MEGKVEGSAEGAESFVEVRDQEIKEEKEEEIINEVEVSVVMQEIEVIID